MYCQTSETLERKTEEYKKLYTDIKKAAVPEHYTCKYKIDAPYIWHKHVHTCIHVHVDSSCV